jgi:hypothetical protein
MFRWNTDLLATAVYDPGVLSDRGPAARLGRAGLTVEANADADDFLRLVRRGNFRTLIVVSDVEDGNSLRFCTAFGGWRQTVG